MARANPFACVPGGPGKRVLLALALVVGLASGLGVPAAVELSLAPTIETRAIVAALDAAFDGSIQQELPTLASPDQDPPPMVDKSLRAPLIIPSEVVMGLWIVMGALVLFWLAREFLLPTLLSASGEEEEEIAEVITNQVDLPLPDYEVLARSQRYCEAIHVMLLRALVAVARRLREPLPDSSTSREVLGRWPLQVRACDDLACLIRSVESCHFGGRAADAAEYRRCVASYERLAKAPEGAP